MTVNTWIKAAAVKYAVLATLGGALLIGCVWGAAYIGQKLDNRAREADQEQLDAEYLPAARAAFKRGNTAEYERLMEKYRQASERNAYSHD